MIKRNRNNRLAEAVTAYLAGATLAEAAKLYRLDFDELLVAVNANYWKVVR